MISCMQEDVPTQLECVKDWFIHDLIIHEMLRKKGKATQHNRKTKQQHNSPKGVIFQRKNVCTMLLMYTHVHVCGSPAEN